MKFQEAMAIIEGENRGFMVSFEWLDGDILRSDHFPDKRLQEPLIPTEEETWELARKFANATKGKVVNLYVTKSDWTPVENYRSKYITNR